MQIKRTRELKSTRGNILDSDGNPLACKPAFLILLLLQTAEAITRRKKEYRDSQQLHVRDSEDPGGQWR